MNSLLIILVAVYVTEIATEDLQSKIKEHFDSREVKSFEEQWKKHQISFEFATALGLQQGYGSKSLNIYMNRFHNPLEISTGYYHTDNQVHFLVENMYLDEMPHIYDVEVNFPLMSNVISVDASVSKIIVRSFHYYMLRNQTSIIYSLSDQKPNENSPFRFEQVRNKGELTIIVEGCSLSGVMIASLSGSSINLGHHQFKLTECQYNLEIFTPGSGAPPVIAPYYPKGPKGLNIENLLLRPLLGELVPKLQSSMYSNINASAVFTKGLPEMIMKQEKIFEDTKSYIDSIVRNINEKTIEKNMGTIKLDDFTLSWDEPFDKAPNASAIKLSDMILLGFDTLYCARVGGPYRLTEIEILDQLRFGTLEVIGKISVNGFQEDNEFAIEVTDVEVDITLDSRLKAKFEVVGWRFLEFSCPKMELLPVEPFVVGYLLNQIPKQITLHLNSVYGGAKDGIHDNEDAAEGKNIANTDKLVSNEDTVKFEVELSGEDEKTLIDNLDTSSGKQEKHIANTDKLVSKEDKSQTEDKVEVEVEVSGEDEKTLIDNLDTSSGKQEKHITNTDKLVSKEDKSQTEDKVEVEVEVSGEDEKSLIDNLDASSGKQGKYIANKDNKVSNEDKSQTEDKVEVEVEVSGEDEKSLIDNLDTSSGKPGKYIANTDKLVSNEDKSQIEDEVKLDVEVSGEDEKTLIDNIDTSSGKQGKYIANTDKLVSNEDKSQTEEKVKLDVEVSGEDEKALIDNIDTLSGKPVLRNDRVKPKYLVEKSHVKDQGDVKLHHVEHQGQVKLHRVKKVKLQGTGKRTVLAGKQRLSGAKTRSKLKYGQVKLNNLAKTAHAEEQVKLHHGAAEPQSRVERIEPHIKKQGSGKPHNVAIDPYVKKVKLRDISSSDKKAILSGIQRLLGIQAPAKLQQKPGKLHDVGGDPHVEERVPVKQHHITALHQKQLKSKIKKRLRQVTAIHNHYRKTNGSERGQAKMSIPNINPRTPKLSNLPLHVGKTTPKWKHVTDNEIKQD